MGRALVVYESMFGNTRAVAEAVAEGLRSSGAADLVEVGSAPAAVPDDVDLLVVGGPTHAFGMSRPATRQSAAEQGADGEAAAHQGIREWLEAVQVRRGLAVAAFDTRTDKRWVPGAAARSADRKLRRLGLRPVTAPEDFYVRDVAGPLVDGEVERARRWAAALSAA
jgi:hypothetical protein